LKSALIAAGVLVSLLTSTPVATPVTTTTSAPTTTTTLVSPAIMAQWGKVAWCESHGNWTYNGARYDGGIGISRGNWVAYGGHEFAPAPHLATPEQQVIIAQRIQSANGYAGFVPDQNPGECHAW
jgi:resuscitation-promoting factor RpfA